MKTEYSEDSTHKAETEQVEPIVEIKNPQNQDVRTEPKDEIPGINIEHSPLPPLLKEREINQPTITSFFTKTPKWKSVETSPPSKEAKVKEKVDVVKSKQEDRTQISPSPDKPIPENKDDVST